MAKDTLFNAQRVLIFLLTFYGFNESNVILKVLNVAIKLHAMMLIIPTLIVVTLLRNITTNGLPQLDYDGQGMKIYFSFIKLYFGANAFCYVLCHFRKRKFNALLKTLKNYDLSETFSKKIRKLNFILWTFFLICSCIECKETYDKKCSSLDGLQRFGFIIFAYLHLICVPLSTLPVCVVASYVNCTVNERVEEVKKSKSPLRRARLTTRLILHSTRLNRLTKATNDYGAPLMLILKMSAIGTSVFAIYWGLTQFSADWTFVYSTLVYNIPCLTFPLVYLWYMRVAPSANQIPSLMARVMVENVMRDERLMSRDPISRIQLLKTRLVHLAHLTHSNFNQEQFTVSGEPVDEADFLLAFVEIIDKLNSLKFILSRLL